MLNNKGCSAALLNYNHSYDCGSRMKLGDKSNNSIIDKMFEYVERQKLSHPLV